MGAAQSGVRPSGLDAELLPVVGCLGVVETELGFDVFVFVVRLCLLCSSNGFLDLLEFMLLYVSVPYGRFFSSFSSLVTTLVTHIKYAIQYPWLLQLRMFAKRGFGAR